MPSSGHQIVIWAFRAIWLAVPFVIGSSIGDALAERSSTVGLTAAVLGWALWAIGLLAALLPRTVSLTAVRFVAPVVPLGAVWAALAVDDAGALEIAGVVLGAAAVAVAWSPAFVDAFVDGSSYGAERRVALRTPPAFLLFIGPVGWAITVAPLVAGPLLVAAEQWIVGAAVTAAGLAIASVTVARLHLLAQRWIVFVPAGIVVHDPLVLTEAMMLPRHLVRGFGPAVPGTAATDLSSGALGLLLELRSAEPVALSIRTGRERADKTGVEAVLVAPARPGTALLVAGEHKLPVG